MFLQLYPIDCVETACLGVYCAVIDLGASGKIGPADPEAGDGREATKQVSRASGCSDRYGTVPISE